MGDIILVKKTQYTNTCNKCGLEIPKGGPCWWEKQTKNNWHDSIACKPQSGPLPKQAPASVPAKAAMAVRLSVADDAKIKAVHDKRVGDRLARAIHIVSEQTGTKPEEINPESILLYETMRQLQSEMWFDKEAK